MSPLKRLIRILAGTPNYRSLPQEARKTVSVFPGIDVSQYSTLGEEPMEIVHKACADLDVHKKTVVAAIIVPGEQGGLRKEVRTFGTMTSDLLTLSDWLMDCEVSHAAMESTGEYWQPVFNILENNFEVLLVNAQHIKVVPGRKTDIKDSE